MLKEKTWSDIYARKQRAFRLQQSVMRELMRQAHPATGGSEMLVNNWGNDAARAISRRFDERWRKYSIASDAAYWWAHHRDHEREQRSARYLWCEHCIKTSSSS